MKDLEDDGRDEFDNEFGVKRGLKTRHLSMMALAGIIGPGLLIGGGQALVNGGPASLLIGFGVVGIISVPVVFGMGEMATLYPHGGFVDMADRFVDKAFGAVVGWNYFIVWVMVLANEYNTVSSIMVFWSDKVPLWGYFLLFWAAFLAFQLLGVKSFGEAEFWLALFKLVGLVIYFFFSLIYACGGVKGKDAVGFRYWHDPGPFNSNGFRGVAQVFIFCSTFYAGIESVAVAASETRNPQRSIPVAVRQVFWRIIVVYMGCAFFFGLTTPANSKELVGGGSKALQSPMTVAIQNAGWSGGVHLVNAFILVTCVSAINSSIYIGSRTIFFMAQQGLLFKIFAWVDKRGVMTPAIVFTNLFGCLALMNVSTGASKAYNYIVNLSGVSTFLVWAAICFTHLRFRASWTAQNRLPSDLPFKAPWFPWCTLFGLLASIFLTLIQGWTSFSPFDAGNFVDAYVLLPFSGVLYIGYKLLLRTKLRNKHEIDLDYGRRKDLDGDSENSISSRRRLLRNL